MKNILLLIVTAIFLADCNNRPVDNKVGSEKSDTLLKSSSIAETDSIFDNPYRNTNNFNFKVGNNFIDSLHYEYSNSKTIETTFTKDICIGDNCESYQTFIKKDNQTVLYFFKGDAGEYGFSNDQYFLKKDSLYFARNFIVNIETWPTDSTETIWRVEEITYNFQEGTIDCLKRTTLSNNLDRFDFTLKNIKLESIKTNNNVYKDKIAELKNLLASKDSADRD